MNSIKEKGLLTIHQTIQHVQEEVQLQEERMKDALVGKGDWILAPEYAHLAITDLEYSRMKNEEKNRYVSQLFFLNISEYTLFFKSSVLWLRVKYS